MKKALIIAPMGSVHRKFNRANIDALQALGYKVELCANFEKGEGSELHNQESQKDYEERGIKTHSMPFVRHSLIGNLKCLPRLRSLLVEGQYDIVHTHTETGGILLKFLQGAKGQSRFVYTPHGMSFWKGSGPKTQMIYKPLERWICSGMDANLGMNLEEYETLLRWNSQTANYVHGIGLNVERMQTHSRNREDVRNEFQLKGGERLILSVGELSDNKNHISVVRALGKLNHRKFKYVVCGVGPNRDLLMMESKNLGLEENVILIGYRSDIPDILNATDIFVFPSYHEGLPVSILEAMACGLPIIASEIRGNVDIINDDDNGFLFKPSDTNTLSVCLSRLLDDAETCHAMGEKNKKIVKAFSLENVTNELKDIYGRF